LALHLFDILTDFFHHVFVAVVAMRDKTMTAVFYAASDYLEIAAAFITQEVERTIAEHTVKPLLADISMTREKCAICISVKFITVFHSRPP